jgi:hypothetical protein
VHIASDVEGLRKQKMSGGHSVEIVHGEGTFVRLATPTISIVYGYFGQSMSSSRLALLLMYLCVSFGGDVNKLIKSQSRSKICDFNRLQLNNTTLNAETFGNPVIGILFDDIFK